MREHCTNTVRALRTARGMTQQALAERVGVTRQTIIAIERGNYTPSVTLALKIARVFGERCDNLFRLT